MTEINNGRLRQLFYIAMIIGLGLLIFWEIYPFITALLGALTLYVLFRKMMFYLTLKRNWNKPAAAVTIMALSFIIILLPTTMLLKQLYNKVRELLNEPEVWLGKLENFINTLNDKFGTDIMNEKNLEQLPQMLGKILPNILIATLDTMLIVTLLYFVLYFMLVAGRDMEHWLYEHIPLKDKNVYKISHEIHNMVFSNAVGIPLLAIIQALFAFGAYWALGVPDPLLWGSMTAFVSVLPVVGSTTVWFPLSLYLYFNGQQWQGIVLFLYGVLVIINVDNVFRIILQKRMADVHPLITMFGVIIGVSLFGFIGLVFGPLLLSMFILLLNIYKDEFIQKQREVTKKNIGL